MKIMKINEFLENMKEVLEDTDEQLIKGNAIFRDFDEWDSMTALSLIAMADQEYSVKLTGDDIKSSNTLEEIFNILKNKVN
jgi:acyl carrier protein